MGQPAATTEDYLPVSAASRATLYGPGGRPQQDHLRTGQAPLGLGSGNSYFNAGLAAQLRQNFSDIQEAIHVVSGGNGSQWYQTRLYHRGKPIVINVDADFYHMVGFKFEWLGNALAIGKGSNAYWPALMEKSFIKLMDSFPADYLHPGDAARIELSDDPELSAFRQRYYGGYNMVEFALPKATLATLTPLPIETVRATPANRERFFSRLQDIASGNRFGIFALLDDVEYSQSAYFTPPNTTFFTPELFDNHGELHFSSGNECIIQFLNTVAMPRCNTTEGLHFALGARSGYTVFGPDADNLAVTLHESAFFAEGEEQ